MMFSRFLWSLFIQPFTRIFDNILHFIFHLFFDVLKSVEPYGICYKIEFFIILLAFVDGKPLLPFEIDDQEYD